MSVLIDTSIWSLAFRRRSQNLRPEQRAVLAEWRDLVSAGRACLIGPIRQEILSGIRDATVFQSLRGWLRYFDLIEITVEDYDQAAEYFNLLRTEGVSASPIDALICAVAHRWEIPVFTTDGDFERYVMHLPIQLHGT